MGNQLTGVAPSQILPVEHYLTDVSDYTFDISLGSTRFFKVARARYKEGLTVVKVFVIHDPSLRLRPYKEYVEGISQQLQDASNCLPYERTTLSDKAALLFRQYVRNNLYDRISTRPFLNSVEKKWIVFQLLCAVNQAHRIQVYHGDIKSENVMVTGWNWILLTDFAGFKPTYIPDDNPADFSFFFDTSRRRTCYIAPERFVDASLRQVDPQGGENLDGLQEVTDMQKGELTPAMDIFSAGCVIAELFTEGHAPFDLSQLLAYRSGHYSPDAVLDRIEDPHIKGLVKHMLQMDPSARYSAEEYLIKWRDVVFPEYFYSYLKIYLGDYAAIPIMPSDEKIRKLNSDMPLIIEKLCPSVPDNQNEESKKGLVIVLSLLTSCLRTLKFCISKLAALDMLFTIAQHLSNEVILDRVIPYILYFVEDEYARVRAAAVKTLTDTVALVKSVPRSDANIFPEYILPKLTSLAQDPVVQVRVAYAENVAKVAETALRFLEMVQLDQSSQDSTELTQNPETNVQYTVSYDLELQNLHDMIQSKVVRLLSDSENIVKRTLLDNGITQLCVFFGRQKANDILLSHMITFLNDKHDWHLRAVFFDNIVGVAAYVGWQSSFILKPLIQQGLADSEEFVICKALNAFSSLVEIGLIDKLLVRDLTNEIVPYLCHPSYWIRHATVGVIATIARTLNKADVFCYVLPLLQPYLAETIIQVDKEPILLSALEEPVRRSIYDYVLRLKNLNDLLDSLHDRQLIRNITRPGHKPDYTSAEDPNLAQVYKKLFSQGMTEDDEEKILLMKFILLKLSVSKMALSMNESAPTPDGGLLSAPGSINLALKMDIQRNHADMLKPVNSRSDDGNKAANRKLKKRPSNVEPIMNEDWKSMFGDVVAAKAGAKQPQANAPVQKAQEAYPNQVTSEGADTAKKPLADPVTDPQHAGFTANAPISMSQLQASTEGLSLKKTQAPKPKLAQPQIRQATCRIQLRKIVAKKREQYQSNETRQRLIEYVTIDTKVPQENWRPKGLLVAHLHEHKAAVNRLHISHDHSFFATCSNDGTVKIWDCNKLVGNSNTNRSRQTYSRQTGRIKSLTFCQSSHNIASASEDGSIFVFKIEAESLRTGLLHSRNLDLNEDGPAIDLSHYDTGSQSVLTYATVMGKLVGWDLRAPGVAWRLQNDLKYGLITTFAVDQKQCWLAVGTSSGKHICWDMRFQLPITTIAHPTSARVRRIMVNALHTSGLISSIQGNNEVSMWDLETGARQLTLWASSSPPLSQSQATIHGVNGMYHYPTNGSGAAMITAGSDQRIRFWDLACSARSYIIAGSANDPQTQPNVSYKQKVVDGDEVFVETYGKQRSSQNEDSPRRGPEQVPPGHRDVITDIGVYHTNPDQSFIVSTSRDGVVKIWK
ncbi:phosphoinositide 3-kinase regulatory subunit 4-like [Anneissia japonica]|uniref:phosphoinositide 3-kinase regulatory subunit 4-like n=1 Tax=Anneissia japonica TaxID=1529436 RepID=UPI001425534B|nr:phosphoinositide 3-kinase regulatory subunit 4-like [Anneissia japonica]